MKDSLILLQHIDQKKPTKFSGQNLGDFLLS